MLSLHDSLSSPRRRTELAFCSCSFFVSGSRHVSSRLGVSMMRRGLTRALERKSRLSCAISRASPHSAHYQALVAFPLVRACVRHLSFFWLLFLVSSCCASGGGCCVRALGALRCDATAPFVRGCAHLPPSLTARLTSTSQRSTLPTSCRVR